MGSKKTTTQKNDFEYKAPPTNQYYQNAAQQLENVDYQSAVHDSYGRAENQIMEGGNEFFGSQTTPEERSKIQQAKIFRLKTQKGRDIQSAIAGENALKTGGYMSLGDAHKAQLVQTGGTTVEKKPFDWAGTLIGGASAGGSLLSGAGAAKTAF